MHSLVRQLNVLLLLSNNVDELDHWFFIAISGVQT